MDGTLASTPPASETRACVACGGTLSAAQVAKGAQSCSGPCRAKVSRERRRRARLAEVDAAIRMLQELRQEIARG